MIISYIEIKDGDNVLLKANHINFKTLLVAVQGLHEAQTAKNEETAGDIKDLEKMLNT